MKLSDRPLRERNAARTRLALLDALVTRLRSRSFADVGVKELCREVGISEPTFFNHFGSKGALLEYFISLWSVSVQCRGCELSGVERLELLFELSGEAIGKNPGLMQEIIAHQISVRRQPVSYPLNCAERLQRYPELADACDHDPQTVPEMVMEALKQARAAGELRDDVDLELALVQVMAVFFGVPAAEPHAARATAVYRAALKATLGALTVR